MAHCDSKENLEKFFEEVGNNLDLYFPLVFTNVPEDQASAPPLDPEELELNEPFNDLGLDDEPRKLELKEDLPVYSSRTEFLQLLKQHQVVVVTGEAGCGKTTKLTQFILDSYIRRDKGSRCKIICTQPRRISTFTVARRVAEERGERLGESVGFQIHLEKCLPSSKNNGTILYCTTGILLQMLKSKNELQHVSHIFLDEVHERSTETDFLIIIMRDMIRTWPDLRLILMSASMDLKRFSRYFGNCPILEILGLRRFEVQVKFLEDIVHLVEKEDDENRIMKFNIPKSRTPQEQEEYGKFHKELLQKKLTSRQIELLENWPEERINFRFICRVINHICSKEQKTKKDEKEINQAMGAILVFLPGYQDIMELYKTIENQDFFKENSEAFNILVLHSTMHPSEMQEGLDDRDPNVRKIILSTNIAETSITIEDVVYVIDCGKANMAQYNARKDFKTLAPSWISQANVIQRTGRAGRVRDGKVFRIYTSARFNLMSKFNKPEICRLRLENLCLRIKYLDQGLIVPFLDKALDKPPLENVKRSISFLQSLHALDMNEELTPLGHHLAKLPIDPQIGKMILYGAIFSCLDPILTISASLQERDIFFYPQDQRKSVDEVKKSLGHGLDSDHLLVAKVYKHYETIKKWKNALLYCKTHFISRNIMESLKKSRQQLANELFNLGFISTPDIKDPNYNVFQDDDDLIRMIICAGLLPNVAKVCYNTRQKSWEVEVNQQTGGIHKKSSVGQEALIGNNNSLVVYHQSMKYKANLLLHDVTFVHPITLFLFREDIENSSWESCAEEWITIVIKDKEVECILKKVHSLLHQILRYKFKFPGETDWNKEGLILKKIILDVIPYCRQFVAAK